MELASPGSFGFGVHLSTCFLSPVCVTSLISTWNSHPPAVCFLEFISLSNCFSLLVCVPSPFAYVELTFSGCSVFGVYSPACLRAFPFCMELASPALLVSEFIYNNPTCLLPPVCVTSSSIRGTRIPQPFGFLSLLNSQLAFCDFLFYVELASPGYLGYGVY